MKKLLIGLMGFALVVGLSLASAHADSHAGDHPGKNVKKPNENSNSQMYDDATRGQDRAAERRNDNAAGNNGKADKGGNSDKGDKSAKEKRQDKRGDSDRDSDGGSKAKSPHKRDAGSALEIDLEPDRPVAEPGFFDRMANLFGMGSESPE